MRLSGQQLKIVKSKEKRVLVHAVAGSGKTTVIKALIRRAIGTGVPVDSILACTFTRKMARELQSANPRLKWCDTIHGVCLRIIEKYKKDVGYKRIILIDEVENDDLIRKVIKRCAVRITMRRAKELIDEYCLSGNTSQRKKTEGIFIKSYLREIKDGQMITYGLMEYFAKKILIRNPNIGFDLVVVDEYQDVSRSEIQIIEMLSKGRIIMVGDAMQGIYSFRGASPDTINTCKPDAIYEMHYSYRLDRGIAEMANSIIGLNDIGYKAIIESKNDLGKVILVDDCSPDAIKTSVEVALNYHAPQDIFVLARTNREIAYLLEMLDGLPVDKDMSAVKNMRYLSYLDVATRAYYNNYYNYGMLRLLSLFEYRDSELIYLENSGNRIYDMVKNDLPIKEFDAIMRRDVPFSVKAKTMLPMFEKQRGEYDRFMIKVLPYLDNIESDLDFMEWYSSISSSDFMPDDKIAVITAHMSKGMESDAVLIPNVRDGKFPHIRGDYQEELRLLYVAMTRARHSLIVHYENSSIMQSIKKET